MIDFLRENIGWLKDLLTAGFAAIGTVIAILTYRRARETFLQPVRSEVIKRQTELLTDLLELVAGEGVQVENSFDYTNSTQANVFLWMREYGFVLSNQEEVDEVITPLVAGWTHTGSSNQLREGRVVTPFRDLSKPSEAAPDSKREHFERAKRGEIEIDKIHFSRSYAQITERLSGYAQNPFMPSQISETIQALLSEASWNMRVALKGTLEEFFRDLFARYDPDSADGMPEVDPAGVYNMFNRKRTSHRPTINRLRQEIREYLKIDSMP